METTFKANHEPTKQKVRSLWLVGESMPLNKLLESRKARVMGRLGEELVCLDPRHGVFPNLVMKPLFAAILAALEDCESDAVAILRSLDKVVCDEPDRRFNVFTAKTTDRKNTLNDVFVFDSQFGERVERLDTNADLWLMFGQQTIAGFLKWILEGVETAARKDLRKCLIKFVDAAIRIAAASPNAMFEVPRPGPSSGAGRIGMLHRLCTESDPSGTGAEDVLLKVVQNWPAERRRFSPDRIVRLLRSTIPLMHNEAYQDGSQPTGNAQIHFVRNAMPPCEPHRLYWQVMGHAIARRSLNRWVEQQPRHRDS